MSKSLAFTMMWLAAHWTAVGGAEPAIEVTTDKVQIEKVPEDKVPASKVPADSKSTKESAKSPEPRLISVKTIDDEQFEADGAEIRNGALHLRSEPVKTIPLNAIERVNFNSKIELAAVWLGQDNHDEVQIGVAPGGNGIQDVHIRLKGLSPLQQIKQLRIVCPSPPRAWRLDPAESPDWLLAQHRAENSDDVDVYFEPPTDDLFERVLQIKATFTDGTSASAKLKASTYTSDAAKIVAKNETPPQAETAIASPPASATIIATQTGSAVLIHLTGRDQLHGSLADFSEEQLALATSWNLKLEIPLLQVSGLLFDNATPETKTRYEQIRAKPDAEDRVLLLAKDGKLAEISGRVKQLVDKQIVVTYQNADRKIDLARMQAIVFAAHPTARASEIPLQAVNFSNGDVLSGSWQALNKDGIVLQTPWQKSLELPLRLVTSISGGNAKFVELSDLEPLAVEQIPYLGSVTPYCRDQAIGGGPLKLGEKTYTKGLAVHSRCVLTYGLDGNYTEFRTTVGFDPAAGQQGRVVCRIVADGVELFAKPDLRATDLPQTLSLPVKGAKQLILEIGFGENENVQDRVIWAAPRLLKK